MRVVKFTTGSDYETVKSGFFHQWIEKSEESGYSKTMAIIELADGTIELAYYHRVTFSSGGAL